MVSTFRSRFDSLNSKLVSSKLSDRSLMDKQESKSKRSPTWQQWLKKITPLIAATKPVWPAGCLCIVSTLSALAFWKMEETAHPCDEEKIKNFTYWNALFFLNSLGTTIGYGNVHPCTQWGRAFTVIYVLVSLPLTVLVLDAIGRIFVWGLQNVWRKLLFKKRTDTPHRREDQRTYVPLYAGILVLSAWLLVASAYFCVVEGWSIGTAVYFTFITFTTIGLGDEAPENYNLTIIDYAVVFVGLALMSMCVRLIQDNIHQLFDNVVKRIEQDYKEKLSTDAVPPEQRKTTANITSVVNEIIADQSGSTVAGFFMTNNDRAKLGDLYRAKANMQNVAVQATVDVTEAFSDGHIYTEENQCQALPTTSNKTIQVRPRFNETDIQTDEASLRTNRWKF